MKSDILTNTEADKIGELVETVTTLNDGITSDRELLDTALSTTEASISTANTAKVNIDKDKTEIQAIKDATVKALNDSTAANITQQSVLEPDADKIPLAGSNGKLNYKWLKPVYIPEPDFHLPLKDNIFLKRGVGTPVTVDISPNQDGSKKVPIPNLYQADFTRDSEATYMDRGVLKKAKVNEPRFETDINGNPLGILIEGASTNLIRYSTTMADWNILISTGRPVIERNLPDFMGGNNAVRVISSENNNDFFGIGSAGLITEATRTFSIWVKRYGDVDVKFKLFMANGTSSSKSEIHTATKTWERFSFTSDNQSREQYAVVLENKPSTMGIEVFAPQVEELPFASSYIPTNGGAAERKTEKLILSTTGNIDADDSFTVSNYSNPNGFNGSAVRTWHMGTHFRGDSVRWGVDAIGPSGNTLNVNQPFDKGNYVVVSDNLEGRVFSNGIFRAKREWLEQPIIYDKLYIGSGYGSEPDNVHWFGHIKDFKIWNRALTDEQIYFLGGADND